jgi:outer membrane protein assembly factor BamB
MFGTAGRETTVAVDTATGKTLWEHTAAVRFQNDYGEVGNGPYAAPLIAGSRVFTCGAAGLLQCFDAAGGKLVWSQDLWGTHGGTRMGFGYASHPIAYRDTVIVPVGGKNKGTIAFRQSDGGIAWARGSLPNAYSSPLLIRVDGLEQLVQLRDGYVFALNPVNGDLQWQIPFRADFSIAVAAPLWCKGNLLFVSAEYGAGAKMIRLRREGQQVKAEEVWATPRLRLHHGNAMEVDGVLYFTSGGKGSQAILTAVESASSKVLWQERSIAKATFVWADGKLITLDEDGVLMIAHPSPKAFHVAARAQVLTSLSWSPPSLAGTRLYARDRKELVALELG